MDMKKKFGGSFGPIHKKNHLQRRKRLSKWMLNQTNGEPSVAFFFSGSEKIRNGDVYYPFRPNSDFYYLTGFEEPNAWLIITCTEKERFSDTILCQPKDPISEIWNGTRVGPKEALKKYFLKKSFSIENLEKVLEMEFEIAKNLFFPFYQSYKIDELVENCFKKIKKQGRSKKNPPQKIFDVSQTVSGFRQIKDSNEIATMKKAAEISAAAHIRAMKFCKPGIHEYEVEAELVHEFNKNGSQSVAYPSIVACGPNTCILHHRAGKRILQKDEMLLIDAGCEIDGYASDITRSYPVAGKFSSPQRDLYEVVLAAQKAAISSTKPDVDFLEPHHAAVRVLSQGMIDLGLFSKKSLNEVIENELYKKFYMHKTGHWLGMDVHDVGDYSKLLKPGMTLTIEPGCYITPSKEVSKDFWNTGIRIEDDALVTEKGCELITRDVPVEIKDIEAIMNNFKNDI